MRDSKTREVGSVNDYGEVKLPNGQWKYLTKKMIGEGFVDKLKEEWEKVEVLKTRFLLQGFESCARPYTVSFTDSKGRLHLINLHTSEPNKLVLKGDMSKEISFEDIGTVKEKLENYRPE